MIDEFGMGESIIPNSTDIVELLDMAKREVNLLLKKNMKIIKKISAILLENEFITIEDIKEIAN